jgi:hypothetical protein
VSVHYWNFTVLLQYYPPWSITALQLLQLYPVEMLGFSRYYKSAIFLAFPSGTFSLLAFYFLWVYYKFLPYGYWKVRKTFVIDYLKLKTI